MPTLQEIMSADVPRPDEDALATIRRVGAELREKVREVADLTERVEAREREINALKHRRLPDLMTQAGVDSIGLPASGNLPAGDIELKPFYKANIAAGWSDDKKAEGFALLEERDYGDAIKRCFTVELKRGDDETATMVRDALRTLGVDFIEALTVPWKTLTAIVREETESGNPFSPAELEKLGATVGRVAELKERT